MFLIWNENLILHHEAQISFWPSQGLFGSSTLGARSAHLLGNTLDAICYLKCYYLVLIEVCLHSYAWEQKIYPSHKTEHCVLSWPKHDQPEQELGAGGLHVLKFFPTVVTYWRVSLNWEHQLHDKHTGRRQCCWNKSVCRLQARRSYGEERIHKRYEELQGRPFSSVWTCNCSYSLQLLSPQDPYTFCIKYIIQWVILEGFKEPL